MKLIICEKPSLAKTVAGAIGVKKQEKGYYICHNNYVVSYVFGHLLELRPLNEYPENKNQPWKAYKLPYIPSPFIYDAPQENTKKFQLKLLKQLSKEAECIIHCGDADREGQVIIDNVIDHIRYKGSVKRLWLPEQTEDTIRSQLQRMKDNKEYLLLSTEGKARAYVDWLYGMNLSVHMTLAGNEMYNIGRVLLPIVHFIYERDKAIQNFIPTPYFVVESKVEDLVLRVKEKFKTFEEAQKKKEFYNQFRARVVDIQEKRKKQEPSKLFSLSTLQSLLSKKYKISFTQSLPIIQKLYESGYITYPRTNTEYLAEAEFDKVNAIISVLKEKGHVLENKKIKKIYDDAKIESHSAITITKKIPTDLENSEKIVYTAILQRFLSNFCKEECILSETTLKIKVSEEEFILKGRSVLQEGYLKYEPTTFEDKLPLCSVGDTFNVNFETLSKMTEAPKPMTEAELSLLLKNPFRKERTNDIESEEIESIEDTEEYKAILKGVQIGTEATRTDTIKKAIQVGYITQEKDKYFITEKGKRFVELAASLSIPLFKEKSVDLSIALKNISLGKQNIDDLLKYCQKELEEICSKKQEIKPNNTYSSTPSDLGECPKCEQGKVLKNKYGLYCDKKCGFSIPKEISSLSCVIPEEEMMNLLKKGKTKKYLTLQKKGTNSKYFAKLFLKTDGSLGFEFEKKTQK